MDPKAAASCAVGHQENSRFERTISSRATNEIPVKTRQKALAKMKVANSAATAPVTARDHQTRLNAATAPSIIEIARIHTTNRNPDMLSR